MKPTHHSCQECGRRIRADRQSCTACTRTIPPDEAAFLLTVTGPVLIWLAIARKVKESNRHA